MRACANAVTDMQVEAGLFIGWFVGSQPAGFPDDARGYESLRPFALNALPFEPTADESVPSRLCSISSASASAANGSTFGATSTAASYVHDAFPSADLAHRRRLRLREAGLLAACARLVLAHSLAVPFPAC